MKNLLKVGLSLAVCVSLGTSAVVVPDEYLISQEDELIYVHGTEHEALLPAMKVYQQDLVKRYEKEYGFKFDDKLSVGLATSNNQIANGFSTQIPFNSQLFYGAGAAHIDYFCFSSWLKTLLIHETAHNFQLNPKENFISRTGHTVLGNNPVSFLGLFPIFPIPNIMESSFILEGNAVLNESRFGNGGRLFSGYALAELVALANAGKITPQLMYNETLEFPYGEKFYLVGGFFQQFLVERYGLEKVQGYFKRYAAQPMPFFTNIIFKKQFGESFETLLAEFVEEVKTKHQAFKSVEGKLIATSKLFVPLNRDKDEVYTLLGDRKSEPKLLKSFRGKTDFTMSSDDYRVGEVFKIKGEYYTQASAKTSPTKVEMGLFDDDGFLKEDSGSKAVQGFTSEGKMVYFDVQSSIETPQVYVDGVFYTQSHSSVHVDKNDLYYFKQEGEKRILFKNKTALYSYTGHYGFVSDVDELGNVYVVASSQHGSTLYKLENSVSKQMFKADDIIDFKLLSKKEALVASVGSDGYSYHVVSLNASASTTAPFTQKVSSVESNSNLHNEPFSTTTSAKKLESKPYNALTQMRYSSLNPFISYDAYTGLGVDVYANFSDPLWRNQLFLVASHNKSRDILGLQYDNSSYRLTFGAAVYGLFKNDSFNNSDKRDAGYEFYAQYPWLKSGYWDASSTLAYTEAYDNIYRKPLTLSLDIENKKQHGFSKYENELNALSLFVSEDRDTNMFGGTYTFKHDLAWQSYVGVKGSYLKSDRVNFFDEKGIELDNGFSSLQSDEAALDVPSFASKTYAKEVKMGELSLAKVFDGSLYFYSFPLSLQRETLYVKQRYYDIDFTNSFQKSYNETTVGTEFDLLFLHKLPIPLSIEWIYNKDVVDQNQMRLLIGGSF